MNTYIYTNTYVIVTPRFFLVHRRPILAPKAAVFMFSLRASP